MAEVWSLKSKSRDLCHRSPEFKAEFCLISWSRYPSSICSQTEETTAVTSVYGAWYSVPTPTATAKHSVLTTATPVAASC